MRFRWKFLNVFVTAKVVERHYKCQITEAYRCDEYKPGGKLIRQTYSLPASKEYNICSEEELVQQLLL